MRHGRFGHAATRLGDGKITRRRRELQRGRPVFDPGTSFREVRRGAPVQPSGHHRDDARGRAGPAGRRRLPGTALLVRSRPRPPRRCSTRPRPSAGARPPGRWPAHPSRGVALTDGQVLVTGSLVPEWIRRRRPIASILVARRGTRPARSRRGSTTSSRHCRRRACAARRRLDGRKGAPRRPLASTDRLQPARWSLDAGAVMHIPRREPRAGRLLDKRVW